VSAPGSEAGEQGEMKSLAVVPFGANADKVRTDLRTDQQVCGRDQTAHA
jgi:hypothetical protein